MPTIASQLAAPRRASILEWASRVQSVTFSTVLHAIVVLVLGGTVLIEKTKAPDFAPEGVLVDDQPTVIPWRPTTLPTNQALSSTSTALPSPASINSSALASLITTSPKTNYIVALPGISTGPNIPNTPKTPPAAPSREGGLDPKIAAGIGNFTRHWAKGGRGSYDKPLRSREFVFTAYLAKYEGGDWDSTVELEDGQIWKGSLPNLLYIISKLSKNKIHAEPQAVPLNLTSGEIFEKKPPFIWFTGHRDFKLTEKEVEVLGEYLRQGGCIWGDSSLPGQRSRFDIAFRREMLRLVPDPNQPWRPLPPNHPIFTKGYYSDIRAVPPGINYYDEPIYMLAGYGGEIAVIYTANDYGDMWQFGIDEKGQVDLSIDERRRYVAISKPMWDRRNIYFRNVEPKSLFDTYKFGTNVIIHLVTRWEDKLRTVPMDTMSKQ
jgi:hypothetical protein